VPKKLKAIRLRKICKAADREGPEITHAILSPALSIVRFFSTPKLP
jgi:hypothetical protein